MGSAVAYVSEDSGRFTVDEVDLGAQDGRKTLVAVASDGAGHEAARGDTITITLDTTAPRLSLKSGGWRRSRNSSPTAERTRPPAS